MPLWQYVNKVCAVNDGVMFPSPPRPPPSIVNKDGFAFPLTQIEENLGEAVVFTLVSSAKDWLDETVSDIRIERIRKEEEAELAKVVGTGFSFFKLWEFFDQVQWCSLVRVSQFGFGQAGLGCVFVEGFI